MKVAKYISNFLSVPSVKNPIVVTILQVLEEEVGLQKEKKIVIYFKELEQGFIPNRGTLRFISETLGTDEGDEWVGKQFELYVDPNVSMQGKRVGGLRLRLPA